MTALNRYRVTTATAPSPDCPHCQDGRKRYRDVERDGAKIATTFRHIGKTENGAWALIPCTDQRDPAVDLTKAF